MRARVLWCLFALSLVTSTALATDGSGLSWNFQQTGFQAGNSGPGTQTALAMRDGETWPVIFSYDYYSSYYVNAYSLYPVSNSTPSSPYTNWHQIGGGLLATGGNNRILSAATSPDGRIGVVARSPLTSSLDYESAAMIGSTATGWGASMSGVRAIDFNAQGGLVKGTLGTIPSSFSPACLMDVAVSPTGETGAIDGAGNYYQKMAWTGEWAKTLQLTSIANQAVDLTMDKSGVPHIVSLTTSSGLVASDFNVMNNCWTSQTLALSTPSSMFFGATVAADDRGGVGAAWVESLGSDSGKLMYAYKKDALTGWATHVVTAGPSSSGVLSNQRVGLAFDANDFPVISFVAGSDKGIWLAYDPPSAVPEPSSLVLLAVGGMFMLLVAGKSRVRRLLGK